MSKISIAFGKLIIGKIKLATFKSKFSSSKSIKEMKEKKTNSSIYSKI